MTFMLLSEANRQILLKLAYQCLEEGVDEGYPLSINLRDYPKELSQQRATYVTLEKEQQVCGFVGMTNAIFPLAEDVCENTFSAAFNDPRFPKLKKSEIENIEISIALLSLTEEVEFSSEQDLITKIEPNVDGLILEHGVRSDTFLPSVWNTITTPGKFLQHLKQKAGLDKNFWSDQIKVYRYTTEIITRGS